MKKRDDLFRVIPIEEQRYWDERVRRQNAERDAARTSWLLYAVLAAVVLVFAALSVLVGAGAWALGGGA